MSYVPVTPVALLEALKTPMGELHYSTPAATAMTVKDTWYKMAGTTTVLTSALFDMPANNRLRYTGPQARHLHCGVSLTVTCSAANQLLEFGIYLNGALLVGSEQSFVHSTGSDRNSTALHAMGHVAQNAEIELWGRNLTSGSKTVTVEDGNIFAVAMAMA